METLNSKIMDEFDIVQNRAIGAHSLYEFVRSFQSYHEKNDGPCFELLMPVLPIVFNERIKKAICKRSYTEGGLINVLTEDKTIFNNLQETMIQMYELSLDSVSLAFSSGLISIDGEKKTLIARKSTIPSHDLNRDYLEILGASKRLGFWFAKFSTEQITNYFNITF